MKVVTLLFSIVLLISCNNTEQLKDHEIVEIPIEVINDYGSFEPIYLGFNWMKSHPNNPWKKAEVKLIGIPENWSDYYTETIFLNLKQFVYQNYKNEIFTEEEFRQIKGGWNVEFEESQLSSKEIKCFVHVVYKKDENGKISYIVDSNNNRDLSDDKVYSPILITKESKNENSIHSITYESKIADKIVTKEAKIIIGLLDGQLFGYSFPQHVETKYKNTRLEISSGGSDIEFSFNSPILIDNSKGMVELNKYLTIDHFTFKNLGVDFSKQVLLLEKMPNNIKIYSSQVGYYSDNFEGVDFVTNDSIKKSLFLGKYLYIDFWGSWCGPCIQELPNLIKTYENIDKSKMEFLGIAVDTPENLTKVMNEKSIKWKQILNNPNNDISKLYNVTGYPTTYLIDPRGIIVAENLRGENLSDTLNYYINKY